MKIKIAGRKKLVVKKKQTALAPVANHAYVTEKTVTQKEEVNSLYWEGENFDDYQYKEDGCP